MLLGTPITLRYSRAWLNRHGWRFRFSIRVEHAHSVTARLQRNGKRLVTRVWRVRGAKRATVQLVGPAQRAQAGRARDLGQGQRTGRPARRPPRHDPRAQVAPRGEAARPGRYHGPDGGPAHEALNDGAR